MTFGVQNTLVKYYSSLKEGESIDGFLTLMLLLPLILILPLFCISYFAHAVIGNFLSDTNAIVKDYVWYIFLIGLLLPILKYFMLGLGSI